MITLAGIPIWVYLTIVMIFVSGVMAFRAIREERRNELKQIEKEGEVFIKRIEQERKRRFVS